MTLGIWSNPAKAVERRSRTGSLDEHVVLRRLENAVETVLLLASDERCLPIGALKISRGS